MKKNIFTFFFPLFFSIIPSILYILLNVIDLNQKHLKFALLVFFVNLAWISFIHFYKKGHNLILSIHLIISVIVSTYLVFIACDKSNQLYMIYVFLIMGIIGLSFFIKRKERN
jgi:hypothetical protein